MWRLPQMITTAKAMEMRRIQILLDKRSKKEWKNYIYAYTELFRYWVRKHGKENANKYVKESIDLKEHFYEAKIAKEFLKNET